MNPRVDPIGAIDAVLARARAQIDRLGVERVVWATLVVAAAISATLILAWGPSQTFVNDEWDYLVVSRGWSLEMLLTPQNGHLIAAPLILYKVLFATVGAESHLPYQGTTVVLHLVVALLFFLLVRRRVPALAALALTTLLIFFGAGWDTIMGAYEIPNLTGMAAGLGMLLALERRSRRADVVASVLLAASLASFSVGIAFAVGASISIWLGGRKQWGRAWVVAAPVALYAIWFVWARKFGQSDVTAEAVSAVLSGIAAQLAALTAAITGLFRFPGSSPDLATQIGIHQEWGYPLTLVLGGLVVLHVRRAPRSIRFWTVVATLLAYLALIAIGLDEARSPSASRYVYMGGILLLLLVAELARDIRWSTASGVVAFVLFGLALMANVAELRVGGRLFAAEGATNRATLAALELGSEHVDPSFPVEHASTTHSHPNMFFPAYAYFDAADDFGSPAFSLPELLAADPQSREAADQELIRAYGLEARPLLGHALTRRGPAVMGVEASGGRIEPVSPCLRLLPDGSTGSFRFELPPGGFGYRAGAQPDLKLARFGDGPGDPVPVRAGTAVVAIPVDSARVPWRAELATDRPALVCPR